MSDAESPQAPGPEHKEKHRVSQWLESHGATVYWEQRNNWNYPTFKIERGDSKNHGKPDLVASFDDCNIAAEFKPANPKSGIYDSVLQLQGYWIHHIKYDQEYICDGKTRAIDGFVTATGNSITGHLFDSAVEDTLDSSQFGKGRKIMIRKEGLPPTEWNMTEQHIRMLYRICKRGVETFNRTQFPAFGTLLSTSLEGDVDPKPAVLWTEPGRSRLYKENWRILP